jgi:hypothetical protein
MDDFTQTSCYLVSEWNGYHLNIEVVQKEFRSFFNVTNLPSPQVDEEVLTAESADETQNDGAYRLLFEDFRANHGGSGSKVGIDDFAIELFKMLHYTGRALERVTTSRVELSLTVCGREITATLPVCLMDAEGTVILIHNSYRRDYLNTRSNEAPLIAYAIAPFQYNNQIRALQGKAALKEQLRESKCMAHCCTSTRYRSLVTLLVRSRMIIVLQERHSFICIILPRRSPLPIFESACNRWKPNNDNPVVIKGIMFKHNCM